MRAAGPLAEAPPTPAGYAPAPPSPAAQIDLSALSTADLGRLLANLRSRGQDQLVAALEQELLRRRGAATPSPRRPAAPPTRVPEHVRQIEGPARSPSRGALAALGGIALAAAAGVGWLALDDRQPTYRRALQPPNAASAPTQPALASSSTPVVEAQPSQVLQPPAGRARAALRPQAREPAPALLTTPPAPEAVPAPTRLARLGAEEVADSIAPPPIPVPRVDAPPPRAMRLAVTPSPAAGAPLVVSRGAAANLLGAPSPRTDPLAGVRSGNPVRMATAVTATGP